MATNYERKPFIHSGFDQINQKTTKLLINQVQLQWLPLYENQNLQMKNKKWQRRSCSTPFSQRTFTKTLRPQYSRRRTPKPNLKQKMRKMNKPLNFHEEDKTLTKRRRRPEKTLMVHSKTQNAYLWNNSCIIAMVKTRTLQW